MPARLEISWGAAHLTPVFAASSLHLGAIMTPSASILIG
jgi:hypothetical protein